MAKVKVSPLLLRDFEMGIPLARFPQILPQGIHKLVYGGLSQGLFDDCTPSGKVRSWKDFSSAEREAMTKLYCKRKS